MNITVAQPKGKIILPFITIFLLISLSLAVAAWQVLASGSTNISSDVQMYLPLFQAVLMILAVALGLTFHSVRTARLKSSDIMGLTHEGASASFKNTEAVLGIAAGGIIRINSKYEIEYINEVALKYCGFKKQESEGKSIYDIVKLQNTNDKDSLIGILENQFKKNCEESDWKELKLLNNAGEIHLLKIKTSPIYNDVTGLVRDLVIIMQDITSDRQAMQKLFEQASRDSLTGLINRHSFQNYMELVIAENEGSNTTNVLCYMDLDHFKTVNDVCGHAAGDELLRQISEMFSKRLRVTDKLARIGGDEFAILLPDCNIKTATLILNRILDDVRNFRFIWRENTFVVGVSIGALEFGIGYRVADIGHLMVAVDEACYSAKKGGRNQLFIKEMEQHEIALSAEESSENDSWEVTLKRAIENDEFILYAQSVESLSKKSNKETSDAGHFYEVLLRLKHEGDVLSPGSFMPTAERLGLMGSVDRWVVSKLVEVIGNIKTKDGSCSSSIFSINISAETINDVEFASFVKLLIEEHGIKASQLCFEVSESDALANFSKVKSMFDDLITLGCCGALDDFGSGFSSLNYLRELPIKYLKVDGTFVRKMNDNTVDAAMVDAVNSVVQTMNILTVAESVEDEETARQLADMGVDYAQGYFFSKPVPLAEIGDYKVAA